MIRPHEKQSPTPHGLLDLSKGWYVGILLESSQIWDKTSNPRAGERCKVSVMVAEMSLQCKLYQRLSPRKKGLCKDKDLSTYWYRIPERYIKQLGLLVSQLCTTFFGMENILSMTTAWWMHV